jgi:hypothetical protein
MILSLKTILNLLSLKIRLWNQSQRSSQNLKRTMIPSIRTNRMIPTKSLNWRSLQNHSSQPGRRRPIAIRSLKVPPERSVSIEPSKVAVQSASFVGRFVSWFACPTSVHCEWVASRRLLYGRT